MLWNVKESCPKAVQKFSQEIGVSELVSNLLIQRDMLSVDGAEYFLNPSLKNLSDPYAIKNLKVGVEQLSRAIDRRDSIFIFGDYDVDGITSIVQILSILRFYGLAPSYCVPHRLYEGYGMSRQAIDRALSGGKPDMMIVVDCGTNSKESIDYLSSLGISLIVIDHHKLTESYPKSCTLINPHVNDLGQEEQPWYNLSAAGLVFKFLHGLIKYRRAQADSIAERIRLSDIIDLAGMGTIADLVPLLGENRIIAWYGLKHLSSNKRTGIVALIEASRMGIGQSLTSSDISFRLGPRINASGRLADASLPVELLLSKDSLFSKKSAQELERLNYERQSIERSITKSAVSLIEASDENTSGYVLYDEAWHSGVVGIVASRVSRLYNRPCIVLGNDGSVIKGSGRSVPGVDLVHVLKECEAYLENWGGHPMAVGISLLPDQLESFSLAFDQNMKKLYPNGISEPELEIASWIDFTAIGDGLLSDLAKLQPFGQGNPEPVFGLKGVILKSPPIQFGKKHKKFILTQEGQMDKEVEGIAWNANALPEPNQEVDLAVRIETHTWNNQKSLRVILVDWRKSGIL
ncbi:MAG: single-stranded-DNA-specific exonuclease RecJ [Puniceicoccaceae bacterium]|nr:single-stranded-DNA-specific exonuclease RecJ [Puniceicoccaceae bacterium]RCL31183.1 MAG: single-stranded-DNA-specific exonuclease RecJ [Puniceicoccaceae bacterium]